MTYSDQGNHNIESEGMGFGIITGRLGDLIILWSCGWLVVLSSLDERYIPLIVFQIFVIN